MGYQRNVFSVLLNVQLADVSSVDVDRSVERIVEPLDELDDGRLAAPGLADERDVCARFDGEVESPQDANRRTGRISEVHVAELDLAHDLWDVFAVGRLGVDFDLVIQQVEDVIARSTRFGDVRRK